MARAAEQFRPADVTFWGIAALVAWGIAILLGNISAIVPANVFAALHTSRLEGATSDQLRQQVAALESDAQRLQRENNALLQRFDLAEEANNAVTQRVGALEVSLPKLLERAPAVSTEIDTSATASIVDGPSTNFDADGGSVSVVQKPMLPFQAGAITEPAPLMLPPAGDTFGVALGFPIPPGDAEVQWQGLTARVGTLLLGLSPVLAAAEGSDGMMVVAGPVATEAQAAALCDRLDQVGIPCKPAPFAGDPIPMLN